MLLGASLLLVAVGVLVMSGSFERAGKVRLVGHDQPVNESARSSTDISAHNSPTLVRNPVRPQNLAVSSRIDTPFFSCALHVSQDGGATWTQTAIPAPTGEEAKCFGPDVAFSADGTLYFAFVTLGGRGNVPHAVWLSTSTDGGKTLSNPTRVAGELSFQVRLAADPVAPKRLYMTYLQAADVGTLKFTAPGNPIMITRTDNAGQTWQPAVRVNNPARGRVIAGAPTVGQDGSIYVAYLDIGQDRLDYEGGHQGQGGPPYPGPTSLILARSTDHATTWAESVAATNLIPIKRFLVFLPEYPSITVDDQGRVYTAYHTNTLGDPDVYLYTLPPDSSTWTTRRVNDTPQHDHTAQYLPKLATAPNGRLDIIYYDRRQDPQNLLNQISYQTSFDHGNTFTPHITLNSKPSDSRIGFGAKEGLPDLGSRLALISANKAALALWTDTRAGIPATQKQDLAEAAIAITAPDDITNTTKTLLRITAIILALTGLALIATTLKPRTREPVAA